MTATTKSSVLVVDDEESNIMALTHILSPEYTVYATKDSQEAVDVARENQPDVILLDIIMPEMNGYALFNALKSTRETHSIPIIFITGLNRAEDEEKGLDMGAADYISKPFSPVVVRLRVKNQIKMINQLRVIELLSMIDQLTSIPNRRGFDNQIDMEWIRAIRENRHISFLIVDVDSFKKYNDAYGHPQGDRALQSIARIITQSLNRPADYAARWGGEEFAVLLPGTDYKGAMVIAERIRLNISNTAIPCADGTETYLTVSVGINTQAPQRASSRENFVSNADKALYKAKQAGGNRACHASDSEQIAF